MMAGESEAQEIAEEVKSSVRTASAVTWGPDKLTCGPDVESSKELILVEGRADVLQLLRAGINNVVSTNGTSVPKSLVDLMSKKTTIAFVDGDRGGDLIIKALSSVGKLDYVAHAPDGKEVEELTGKEIIKSLRGRESVSGARRPDKRVYKKPLRQDSRVRPQRKPRISSSVKDLFIKGLKDVSGTKQAEVLDGSHKVMGRMPLKSIKAVSDLGDVYAVIIDGSLDDNIAFAAKKANARYLVGKDSKITKHIRGLNIVVEKDLA
jgi:5S rRNA maturation endonuclease (ribonuclease M5)